MIDTKATIKNLIIDALGLGHIVEKLLAADPERAAYHNAFHALSVTARAITLFPNVDASVQDIVEMQRTLAVAALLHDYGHSLGKLTDEENVRVAMSFARNAVLCSPSDLFRDRERTAQEVERLIACTQYPFVTPPDTLLERLLRDADLAQSLELDFDATVSLFRALKTEIETSQGQTITNVRFAAGMRDWWDHNLQWFTYDFRVFDRAMDGNNRRQQILEAIAATADDAELAPVRLRLFD
jgi:HD domain